jgi:hypothetical protein
VFGDTDNAITVPAIKNFTELPPNDGGVEWD